MQELRDIEENIKNSFLRVKEDLQALQQEIFRVKKKQEDILEMIEDIKDNNPIIEIKKTDENNTIDLVEIRKEISALKQKIGDLEKVEVAVSE